MILLPVFKQLCLGGPSCDSYDFGVMRGGFRLGLPLVLHLQLCGQGPAYKGSKSYSGGNAISQPVGSAVREHGTPK